MQSANSQPVSNQYTISESIAATSLMANKEYFSVFDVYSETDGNGYRPCIYRWSDSNNMVGQPFCIGDYSSHPITHAMAALEGSNNAILAWLHWEKNSFGFEIGNIRIAKLRQEGNPLIIPNNLANSRCDSNHYAYIQSNSLAVTTFSDDSFLLGWTQVCYGVNDIKATNYLALFNSSNQLFWGPESISESNAPFPVFSNGQYQSMTPTDGMASYGVTLNSLLTVDDNNFVSAYYSGKDKTVQAFICLKPTKSDPGHSCLSIFNISIQGNRFSIKTALYNQKLYSSWQSQNHIYMNIYDLTLYNKELGFFCNMPTQQISYGDEYLNTNHGIAVSNNTGNALVAWHSYFIKTGANANVTVRQIYLSDPAFIQIVPNFATTPNTLENSEYCNLALVFLQNGLFAINVKYNNQYPLINRNFSEMKLPLSKASSPFNENDNHSSHILFSALGMFFLLGILAKIIHSNYNKRSSSYPYKELDKMTSHDIEMPEQITPQMVVSQVVHEEVQPMITATHGSSLNCYATYYQAEPLQNIKKQTLAFVPTGH